MKFRCNKEFVLIHVLSDEIELELFEYVMGKY